MRLTFLADAYRRKGALASALSAARAAAAIPLPSRMTASLLARIHGELGELEPCLQVADVGAWYYPAFSADLSTSKALALRALGRDEEARASLAKARDVVLGAARDIEDPEIRHSFLTNVEECVRTLALAREWFGDAG